MANLTTNGSLRASQCTTLVVMEDSRLRTRGPTQGGRWLWWHFVATLLCSMVGTGVLFLPHCFTSPLIRRTTSGLQQWPSSSSSANVTRDATAAGPTTPLLLFNASPDVSDNNESCALFELPHAPRFESLTVSATSLLSTMLFSGLMPSRWWRWQTTEERDGLEDSASPHLDAAATSPTTMFDTTQFLFADQVCLCEYRHVANGLSKGPHGGPAGTAAPGPVPVAVPVRGGMSISGSALLDGAVLVPITTRNESTSKQHDRFYALAGFNDVVGTAAAPRPSPMCKVEDRVPYSICDHRPLQASSLLPHVATYFADNIGANVALLCVAALLQLWSIWTVVKMASPASSSSSLFRHSTTVDSCSSAVPKKEEVTNASCCCLNQVNQEEHDRILCHTIDDSSSREEGSNARGAQNGTTTTPTPTTAAITTTHHHIRRDDNGPPPPPRSFREMILLALSLSSRDEPQEGRTDTSQEHSSGNHEKYIIICRNEKDRAGVSATPLTRVVDAAVGLSAWGATIVFMQYATSILQAVVAVMLWHSRSDNENHESVAASTSSLLALRMDPLLQDFPFLQTSSANVNESAPISITTPATSASPLSNEVQSVVLPIVLAVVFFLVSLPRSYHTLRFSSWTGTLLTLYLVALSIVSAVVLLSTASDPTAVTASVFSSTNQATAHTPPTIVAVTGGSAAVLTRDMIHWPALLRSALQGFSKGGNQTQSDMSAQTHTNAFSSTTYEDHRQRRVFADAATENTNAPPSFTYSYGAFAIMDASATSPSAGVSFPPDINNTQTSPSASHQSSGPPLLPSVGVIARAIFVLAGMYISLFSCQYSLPMVMADMRDRMTTRVVAPFPGGTAIPTRENQSQDEEEEVACRGNDIERAQRIAQEEESLPLIQQRTFDGNVPSREAASGSFFFFFSGVVAAVVTALAVYVLVGTIGSITTQVLKQSTQQRLCASVCAYSSASSNIPAETSTSSSSSPWDGIPVIFLRDSSATTTTATATSFSFLTVYDLPTGANASRFALPFGPDDVQEVGEKEVGAHSLLVPPPTTGGASKAAVSASPFMTYYQALKSKFTTCAVQGDLVDCVALMAHLVFTTPVMNDYWRSFAAVPLTNASSTSSCDGSYKKNHSGHHTNSVFLPVILFQVLLLLHFVGAYPVFCVTARKALLSGVSGRHEGSAKKIINTPGDHQAVIHGNAPIQTELSTTTSPTPQQRIFDRLKKLLTDETVQRVLLTAALVASAAAVAALNSGAMANVFALNAALFGPSTAIALPAYLLARYFLLPLEWRRRGRGGCSHRPLPLEEARRVDPPRPAAVAAATDATATRQTSLLFNNNNDNTKIDKRINILLVVLTGASWATFLVGCVLTVAGVVSWSLTVADPQP